MIFTLDSLAAFDFCLALLFSETLNVNRLHMLCPQEKLRAGLKDVLGLEHSVQFSGPKEP